MEATRAQDPQVAASTLKYSYIARKLLDRRQATVERERYCELTAPPLQKENREEEQEGGGPQVRQAQDVPRVCHLRPT